MTDVERLRIVVFGSSIVSDWDNPLALSARAILSEMDAAGHEVTFLEERNNRWLLGLLKTRGMAPVRAFEAAYPELQHRTYDVRQGYQRTIEFAQHVGTADAIVALPGTPESIVEEIDGFRSRSVVRAVHVELGDVDSDLKLGSAGSGLFDAPFGPAASFPRLELTARQGTAIVAYTAEGSDLIRRFAAAEHPILFDQTLDGLPGWEYTPAPELADRYHELERVIVLGEWRTNATWSRLLLPWSRGCAVVAAGPGAGTVSIPGVLGISDAGGTGALVRAFRHVAPASLNESKYAALGQSRRLVDALLRIRSQKRLARVQLY